MLAFISVIELNQVVLGRMPSGHSSENFPASLTIGAREN